MPAAGRGIASGGSPMLQHGKGFKTKQRLLQCSADYITHASMRARQGLMTTQSLNAPKALDERGDDVGGAVWLVLVHRVACLQGGQQHKRRDTHPGFQRS